LLCVASQAAAQTVPPLGTTTTFAVLGGSTVTNTGTSVLTGDLGVWPGLAITGFPPGTVTGTTHAGDAVAQQAQTDLTAAYNDLAGQACGTDLTGQDLGGLTLTSGVYCFTTSAQLTGTLTLDAQGDPNAVFVFQIGTTLTTASSSSVLFLNGGPSCNVFWQVGSSATLGTSTTLAGSILALQSITLTTSANVSGQLLARNGAVTLDTGTVSLCVPVCPPMTILPATLPNPVVGTPYSQPITAAGSTPDTYVYTVTAGALPPGLLLDSATPVKTVNLAGTPTTPGAYSFTITATDANGCQVSQAYSVLVAPAGCPTVTVLPATLPSPVLGVLYTETISATGGASPYVYSVSAGALPPGLLLSPLTATPTAGLSGTPTATGSFSFTITAIDANGCPGSRDYTFFVDRVTGIPTLSTWGLLILMGLTGLVAAWYLRRAA
jgi:type VI secretion system secreted protein VgrG